VLPGVARIQPSSRRSSTIPFDGFLFGAKTGQLRINQFAHVVDKANGLKRRETLPRLEAIGEIDAPPLFEEVGSVGLASSEKFVKQTPLSVPNARERWLSSASLTSLMS
jgi:hypothetical protein